MYLKERIYLCINNVLIPEAIWKFSLRVDQNNIAYVAGKISLCVSSDAKKAMCILGQSFSKGFCYL